MGSKEDSASRRVAYIVGTLDSGGIERLVSDWCVHLKHNTEWRPVVICILKKKGIFLEVLEAEGIEVFECRLRSVGWRPFPLRMARVIRQAGIRIIHSQVAFSLLWQILGFVLGGARRIIFTQHNEYKNWNSFWAKARLRFYYLLSRPFIDHYTCVSERVRKSLAGLLNTSIERFSVIYNSVNTSVFFPQPELRKKARAAMGILSDVFTMGMVANLSVQKGHDYLLKACALLKKKDVSFKLVLVGNGDFSTLDKTINSLGISDNVICLGRRTDVAFLLQGFDCFVLPSLWEGLPLALIEAMACQLPVVASDNSGTAEVIRHNKTGLLFPCANEDALERCLKQVIDSPVHAAELAVNGYRDVKRKFHLPNIMKEYILLYQ